MLGEMRQRMEEGLKPGTVRNLLKRCNILRSIIREGTQGNVDPPLDYLAASNVPKSEVDKHLKDIPKLENDYQEMVDTAKDLSEQRRLERTSMLTAVQMFFGVPLPDIIVQRIDALSAADSKRALPLFVKLAQNLYLEFTTNDKQCGLLHCMETFEREERDGFRMVANQQAMYVDHILKNGTGPTASKEDEESVGGSGTEEPLDKNTALLMAHDINGSGSLPEGSALLKQIDERSKERYVGLLLEKNTILRVMLHSPLKELDGGEVPSEDEVQTKLKDSAKLEKVTKALWDQICRQVPQRSGERMPLLLGAHSFFDCSFQLADDARIDALPIAKAKEALGVFFRLTQNLYEELMVAEKKKKLHRRELEVMAEAKCLYKAANDVLLVTFSKYSEQQKASTTPPTAAPKAASASS